MPRLEYRRDFGPESVEELRANIQATHEDFLREDDTEKKADAFRYLCAYAMQFLYLVPHDKKFTFKETERVLHQSAMNISDFDPREASVAFEYLSKYAQNILDQPWRRDFHTIKLTGGFYVHNIAAQLCNAHEILVAMGYVHVNETTLQILPKLEEKRIKEVSKDMIVASQECLILSQVWQRVADQEPDYPLTIGEVFEFRQKYSGDTDAICKAMLTDIRRRDKMHRASRRSFVPVDKLIDYDNEDQVDRGNTTDSLMAENVRKYTSLLHERPGDKEEHIYDPVCPDSYQARWQGGKNHLPHHNSSPFVPIKTETETYPYYDREPLDSPLIPVTVSSFAKNDGQRQPGTHNGLGSSTSLGSAAFAERGPALQTNGNGFYTSSHPLTFSKVSPDEIPSSWKERDKNRRKTEGNISNTAKGSTLQWSEWSNGTNPNPSSAYGYPYHTQGVLPHHRGRSSDVQDTHTRSRKPIMPNDVYPDDYFPRVIKPTPVQPSLPQPSRFASNHRFAHLPPEESGEDDMLSEALAYQLQVNSNSSNKYSSAKNGNRPGKSGWEPDSRSLSSEVSISRFSDNEGEGKRTPSSTEASSAWDHVDATIQRSKQQYAADPLKPKGNQQSSSGSSSSNHYRERTKLQPSLKLSPSTGGGLESIQDLYYNQLLNKSQQRPKQGPEKSPSPVLTPTEAPSFIPSDPNLNTVEIGNVLEKKKVSTPDLQSPRIVPWSCPFCTFKNKKSERICEVCFKSKDFRDEDSDDVVGVPEPPAVKKEPKLYSTLEKSAEEVPCPQCTLLNPRSRFECDACHFRLRNANSPKNFM